MTVDEFIQALGQHPIAMEVRMQTDDCTDDYFHGSYQGMPFINEKDGILYLGYSNADHYVEDEEPADDY